MDFAGFYLVRLRICLSFWDCLSFLLMLYHLIDFLVFPVIFIVIIHRSDDRKHVYRALFDDTMSQFTSIHHYLVTAVRRYHSVNVKKHEIIDLSVNHWSIGCESTNSFYGQYFCIHKPNHNNPISLMTNCDWSRLMIKYTLIWLRLAYNLFIYHW